MSRKTTAVVSALSLKTCICQRLCSVNSHMDYMTTLTQAEKNDVSLVMKKGNHKQKSIKNSYLDWILSYLPLREHWKPQTEISQFQVD